MAAKKKRTAPGLPDSVSVAPRQDFNDPLVTVGASGDGVALVFNGTADVRLVWISYASAHALKDQIANAIQSIEYRRKYLTPTIKVTT